MKHEDFLQQLIAKGARYIPAGKNGHERMMPLAAAHILDSGEIWLCRLWPENEFHQLWCHFDRSEMLEGYPSQGSVTAPRLELLDWRGKWRGCVEQMEEAECERHQWSRWSSTSPDEVTTTARAFVRALEVGIIPDSISKVQPPDVGIHLGSHHIPGISTDDRVYIVHCD